MGKDDSITGYDSFVAQIPAVTDKFPKLLKTERDGKFLVAGEIDIVDNSGRHWETYDIEIHCSYLFPKRFPDLYETGKKSQK